jgi:hypothetical protein
MDSLSRCSHNTRVVRDTSAHSLKLQSHQQLDEPFALTRDRDRHLGPRVALSPRGRRHSFTRRPLEGAARWGSIDSGVTSPG